MARLPLADATTPAVAAVHAAAFPALDAFANQIQTLAHRPSIAANLVRLYLGFSADSVVDRRLVELAILTVSLLNRCDYCVVHHDPLGRAAGLTTEQLAALAAGEGAASPQFDGRERLVIAYATQVTRDAQRVTDDLFTALQTHFDTAQIVELTLRISLANFFNRFNDALQLDIEPAALAAASNLDGIGATRT